jgi:hypothetical protein
MKQRYMNAKERRQYRRDRTIKARMTKQSKRQNRRKK